MGTAELNSFLLPKTLLIRTRNLHRLRQVISREAEPIKYAQAGTRQNSCVEITKLELPGSKIFGLNFDSTLDAEIAPIQNFELYFVGSGSLTVINEGGQSTVHAGEGIVYFPGDMVVHHWEPGSQALALFVEKTVLEPFITDFYLLESHLLSSHISSLSYTSGLFRSIFNLLMQISLEMDRTQRHEDKLDSELELLLHHSCALLIERMLGKRFESLELMQAPPYLKRAVLHIIDNLKNELTLKDISDVSEVSSRMIQYAFVKYFNQSPTAFITNARLCKVREELIKANRKDTTVTKVAMDWGFHHASNFARNYHSFFGEYPSDTLQQNSSNFKT